ncbi:MAG: hydroxymethylglutaryl-CoA reductase [Candidatus Aenigmarchaeota archaeon]|nr:hydroxymethylglutaryl-CoA reductase [Candidatus Aenigmarchaeota archaeon]
MGLDKIYQDLKEGKIKPYKLEEVILEQAFNKDINKFLEANKEAVGLRLRLLEEKTGKKYGKIRDGFVSVADKEKGTVGIEQQIGGAVVPLGFGGPLKVIGEHVNGEVYLPVATNEAALVAGLTRGCRAINEAGGIRVVITRDHMTRAPLIEAPDIKKARELSGEILKKGQVYNKMKEAAEKESKVSKLLDIQPFQSGRHVHLRFYFQTGDSMGMNSVTKYSANAVKALKEVYTWVKLVSLTANMCTDKKATHMNVLLGRGKSVETEILIPRKIIKEVYDVEPEDIVKLNYLKNYRGSALAGSIGGFNANVANTIAAMFIATGQDAAQVVESSSCFTNAEVVDGDLLFSASFPCIEVATVGGGAGYGTAKECLDMLGCAGPGTVPGSNSRKLAEIIAAAASAQDLNLIAAESHGYELAESHIKLARGK